MKLEWDMQNCNMEMCKQLDIKQPGLILLFTNHYSVFEAFFSTSEADNLSIVC